MSLIDGYEYYSQEFEFNPILCPECNGSGTYPLDEDDNEYGICNLCYGDGYIDNEDAIGICIYCGKETMNIAYGYYLCTECDPTREKHNQINDPARYDRTLFDYGISD